MAGWADSNSFDAPLYTSGLSGETVFNPAYQDAFSSSSDGGNSQQTGQSAGEQGFDDPSSDNYMNPDMNSSIESGGRGGLGYVVDQLNKDMQAGWQRDVGFIQRDNATVDFNYNQQLKRNSLTYSEQLLNSTVANNALQLGITRAENMMQAGNANTSLGGAVSSTAMFGAALPGNLKATEQQLQGANAVLQQTSSIQDLQNELSNTSAADPFSGARVASENARSQLPVITAEQANFNQGSGIEQSLALRAGIQRTGNELGDISRGGAQSLSAGLMEQYNTQMAARQQAILQNNQATQNAQYQMEYNNAFALANKPTAQPLPNRPAMINGASLVAGQQTPGEFVEDPFNMSQTGLIGNKSNIGPNQGLLNSLPMGAIISSPQLGAGGTTAGFEEGSD